MLGNQSHSGLDINKHPSNCPFFVLIPPPLPGPAWTPTNNTTTTRCEQWCRLKKPQGGWIDSLALTAQAKRKHVCLGGFVCVGEIFTYFIYFFYFPFFPASRRLSPGRGARRCWWWYNNTVRCLWPIPCHLDFCVNHHVFFSSFLFTFCFSLLDLPFFPQGVIFFCSNYLSCGLPDATIAGVVWILMEAFLCKCNTATSTASQQYLV